MRLPPALLLLASSAFARDLPNVDAFLDSNVVRSEVTATSRASSRGSACRVR